MTRLPSRRQRLMRARSRCICGGGRPPGKTGGPLRVRGMHFSTAPLKLVSPPSFPFTDPRRSRTSFPATVKDRRPGSSCLPEDCQTHFSGLLPVETRMLPVFLPPLISSLVRPLLPCLWQCQRWLIVASRADSKCAQSSSQASSAGSACIRDNSPWSWESSSAENPAKASRSTSATATSIDATARLPSAVISTI